MRGATAFAENKNQAREIRREIFSRSPLSFLSIAECWKLSVGKKNIVDGGIRRERERERENVICFREKRNSFLAADSCSKLLARDGIKNLSRFSHLRMVEKVLSWWKFSETLSVVEDYLVN